MTAYEALWLIKAQLQKTEQNLEAVKVLSDIVAIVNKTHIDDEPETLDHLFGDVAYDLSKLTLVESYVLDEYDAAYKFLSGIEKTYTLEEAKKILDIDDAVAYQLYGTEAQHIKNHMAKVAERDLRKREIALEYEKTYDEVTGRSCARYELVEED
jgi:hypothetical protein